MRWPSFLRPPAPPPPPVRSRCLLTLGRGETITWADVARHVLVMGSSGSGKSFSTRPLLGRMLADSAGVVLCMKPTEWADTLAMARQHGFADRLVRVCPGSGHAINPLAYLMQEPHGSPQLVGEYLGHITKTALALDGNGQGDRFWVEMPTEAQAHACTLIHAAGYEPSFRLLLDVVNSSPISPRAASKPLTGAFGKVVTEGQRDCPAHLRGDLARALGFYLGQFASVGFKARGAILATVNSTVGRLTGGAFADAFGSSTNLTPEIIAEQKLIVCLDYPPLVHGPVARTFALAWSLLVVNYCLRRPPGGNRVVVVRDESQLCVCPAADFQAATTGRSQGITFFDVVQDADVAQAAFGGGEQARHQCLAWMNQHGVRLCFGTDSKETCDYFQGLAGEHKELLSSFGGGGQRGPTGDFLDDMLGVGASSHHMSESYRPRLAPGVIPRLRVGEAVVFVSGRSLGAAGYRCIDLKRRE